MYNLDTLVGVIPMLVFPVCILFPVYIQETRQSAIPEYVFRLCISDTGPGVYWAL